MPFHMIGDEDTVLGFRFAGVSTDAVDSPTGASTAFQRVIAEQRCRILLLTRTVAVMIEDELTAHRVKAEPPFIVVLDDLLGSAKAEKSLEQMIHEAVGIRIVHEDNQ